MSVGRTLVAISLDHDRLCALSAAVGGDRVRIKAWHSAPLPEGVDTKDAAAVGRWVGEALKSAGIGKGPVVFAVPRGEVVLKKLKLPAVEGGEGDVAGMVRLQMARQLTMAIDGTAIDYVPMTTEQRSGEGGASGDSSVTVLAGALPGDRMEWYRQAAKAAGMKIARIGLKAAGVSALLADASQRHGGPVLGIAAGWGAIEFVVVEDGHLVFARSADIDMATPSADDGAFVSRVAVEAKRTWMSYRVGQESAIVERVAVLGDGQLAKQIGEAAGGALEMPWEPIAPPAAIELPEDMPEAERLVAAPLLGLLAESIVARPSLDFANPRRAPDLSGVRRQRLMLAALLAIIAGGGLYVYGQGELSRLRERVGVARENAERLRGEYVEHVLAKARLDHLERWNGAGVDWLAHAQWLSEQLPSPREGLLDSVRGTLSTAVEYTGTGGAYSEKSWSAKQAAVFALDGQVKKRSTANDLRGRLVTSGVYHVDSRGPDVPDRFSFQLTTAAATPEGAAGAAPGTPEAPAGGGQSDEGVTR